MQFKLATTQINERKIFEELSHVTLSCTDICRLFYRNNEPKIRHVLSHL